MADEMTPDSTRRHGTISVPVRLADGADWGFLRPSVRLFPKVVSEVDPLGRTIERVTVELGFGYPLEVERLVDQVRAACDRGEGKEQYEAFFTLAVCLITRVHEISRFTACQLLSVSEGELPRLVKEIMAVVSEGDPACGPDAGEESTND